ncbi:LOW QUALITY PROTEIN: putative germin-like protein 2-1 [Cinnamomum micranthum f. kanehirae]|uniref:Putative germin-like protein 2-1 n=1 Tax=Cinnamomum micranthum f. kanehirae TaxID=337451 RepID=A0A3S3Q9J5_9MAGN|nr:LOW QUALITY PROTEIN: putative germin-like protein 2-1 [Cinnamomum micranthum f. kanehirae]
MVAQILVVVLLSITSSLVYAYDPSPPQDICVAEKVHIILLVNGFVCKDIKMVTAGDFFFEGLDKSGNTSNNVGDPSVCKLTGLNTLGISLACIDFASYGENPPHTHPRATEILTVLEGTLYVGFVVSNQNNNTLITKVLNMGDAFVFPIGLIHFQANIGHTPAVAIAALSSQNLGVITIANYMFGSKPPISDDIPAKAFEVDKKIMKMVAYIVVLVLFSITSSLVFAYDPSPLQDICVADDKSDVLVNGFVCKDNKKVTAHDFFFEGLDKPGNTENKVGFNVTTVNVDQIPGLNTLGISLVRIDYAPNGQNPPHTHPRGTEILTVIEGTLYVGFVLSNQNNNTLITKTLNKGDVFVFPIGLIHFQANIGHTPAVAIAALSSQNAGVITIANSVFGSMPPISDDILAKAFQVDKQVIDHLQAQFWIIMKMVAHIVVLVLFSITSSLVFAYDPSPLQDICVADDKSDVLVNGFVCKDNKEVTARDFFYYGLDKPGNTGNKNGFAVTTVNVDQIPGLNTLGISLVRIDYAPNGQNPPHTHPRGTEILTVIEGTLYVGFVLSNQNNNTLITKTLNKGDVFVFPIGLIHFQANIGHTPAVAIAALSSQNAGVITIADSVFGSMPPISDDILAKAFQVDKKVIDLLQAQFSVKP